MPATVRPLILALTLTACPGDPGGDDTGASGSSGAPQTTADEPTSTASIAPTTGEPGTATTAADTTGDDTTGPAPLPLPPLADAVPLTDEQVRNPVHARDEELVFDPRLPADLTQMLAMGYGEVAIEAGEPVLPRTLDESEPPAPGPAPKLLTRFVHLADVQLSDDESPARLASFDQFADGAYRPQEGHLCRMLNAAARTINRIHKDRPLGFVLLGGDNTDNSQGNELAWFLGVLDGAPAVECDSAVDDDPVPGPDNDPKDPFAPVGLDIPWRWVTGNHDILRQGTWPTAEFIDEPTSASADNGTRDWSQPGAPIVMGKIPADPMRAFVTELEQLMKVAADGDGHGITEGALALGRAFYTFDIEGTPLRIFVMSTASATGSSKGLIRQADIDAIIEPTLQAAAADDKLVLITSHHRSGSLNNGTEPGLPVGMEFADALLADDWISYLGTHPHVIMHLAAHSHRMSVTGMLPLGGHAYWEMASPALADFPHEMRLVEIWDQDNDFLSIRSIAFDFVTDDDPIADIGRTIGVADFIAGWEGDGRGDGPEARNVELWIPKP